MTTRIYVAFSASDAAVERVKTAVAEVMATDPNWNGATWELLRDYWTYVDSQDEINATRLLHETIYPALDPG